MSAVTNRLRVFAFGIAVALLGLVNPGKALQVVNDVLNAQDRINNDIDNLSK